MADDRDDVKDLDKNDRGEKDNRATGTEPRPRDEPVGETENPPPTPPPPGDINSPGKTGGG
jgi:hypothetical protein